jgi:thiamine transporter
VVKAADPKNLIQVILAEGKKMSKGISVRVIAEAAIVVALSTVLSFIKIYHLPYGGSITAGSMVPLLWIALRRGSRVGIFTCFIYGLVQFMLEPWIVSPIQVFLDYPLAFGLLGLAGLFQNYPLVGVGIGISGRFISHLLSGVVFFSEYAPPGMSPLIYSAVYNGSYLLPEFIVSAIFTYIIVKSNILKIYM